MDKIYDKLATQVVASVSLDGRRVKEVFGKPAELATSLLSSSACRVTLKQPVYTEESGGTNIIEAERTNIEQMASVFCKTLKTSAMKSEGLAIQALAHSVEQAEKALARTRAHYSVHGIVNEKNEVLFGNGSSFKVVIKVKSIGQQETYILCLDPSFIRKVKADVFINGYTIILDDKNYLPQGISESTRVFDVQDNFIYEEFDYSNHQAISLAECLYPTATLTVLGAQAILCSGLSDKNRQDQGITIYDVHADNILRKSYKLTLIDALDVQPYLLKRSADLLDLIASNGTAQTGLSIAAEGYANAAISASNVRDVLFTDYGETTAYITSRATDVVGAAMCKSTINSEEELDELLRLGTLCISSSKGSQATKGSSDIYKAVDSIFGLNYRGQALATTVLSGGIPIGAINTSRGRCVPQISSVSSDYDIKEKAQTLRFSVNNLTSLDIAQAISFVDEERKTVSQIEVLINELKREIGSINIQSLVNEYQAAQRIREKVLNAAVKAYSANLQIPAAAAAIMAEIDKILATDIVLAVYGQIIGVMNDFIILDWSTSTASYDRNALNTKLSAIAQAATCTRVKASWTTYSAYIGDVAANSPWEQKETQFFNRPFNGDGSFYHGTRAIRIGRNFCANLAAYGMPMPTIISTKICERKTRKSGSKTVEVVPQITRTTIGLQLDVALEAIAQVLTNFLRSDALRAVRTARILIESTQQSISAQNNVVKEKGSLINQYVERMYKLGDMELALSYHKGLASVNPENFTGTAYVEKVESAFEIPASIADWLRLQSFNINIKTNTMADLLSQHESKIDSFRARYRQDCDERINRLEMVRDQLAIKQSEKVELEENLSSLQGQLQAHDDMVARRNELSRASRPRALLPELQAHLDQQYNRDVAAQNSIDSEARRTIEIQLQEAMNDLSTKENELAELRGVIEEIEADLDRAEATFNSKLSRLSIELKKIQGASDSVTINNDVTIELNRSYVQTGESIYLGTVPEDHEYIEFSVENGAYTMACLLEKEKETVTSDSESVEILTGLRITPIAYRKNAEHKSFKVISFPGFALTTQAFLRMIYSVGGLAKANQFMLAAIRNSLGRASYDEVIQTIREEVELTELERDDLIALLSSESSREAVSGELVALGLAVADFSGNTDAILAKINSDSKCLEDICNGDKILGVELLRRTY